MTIGLSNRSNIIIDKNKNILNFRSEIATVIHQYNRKPDIVKIIEDKYCPELLINKQIIIVNKNITFVCKIYIKNEMFSSD